MGELPRVEAALTTRTWKSDEKRKLRCLSKILNHPKGATEDENTFLKMYRVATD